MTYIEFFDKTATENICACLTRLPERVVFVGRDKKQMERFAEICKAILSGRGQKTEFVIRAISRNNLDGIVELFSNIVNSYKDCVFDLTGGDELYLVGAGMTFERFPEKRIELVRFNINSKKVYDCDNNGRPDFSPFPYLSIEENIAVYGGEIIWDKGATYRWDNNRELFEDIDKIWNICKRDVKRWNTLVTVFEAADKVTRDNSLDSGANIHLLTTYTEKLITKQSFDAETMDMLLKEGLINSWEFNGTKFRLRYKNQNIKRCLTKAGQALEMKIYATALKAAEKDGTPVFNDVLTGVCIDWDGKKTGVDTENEIDVMMMSGLIPVFVSCKNGYVEIDELYKLNTVAQRFGGKYAKKLLVASALDLDSGFGKILKARADDMGIGIIADEITTISDVELDKRIKSFWR